MGDEDEPGFPLEVGGYFGPGGGVQVIGRLVDQQKVPLLQKQGGQQGLGLLPVGQGAERPFQGAGVHPQQRQLTLQLPAGGLGADLLQHGGGGTAGLFDREGKIVEGHR